MNQEARNPATGRGVLARDGSAVELYKLLEHLGEADIVHGTIPDGAAILELGCGVGRVTHPLLALGHPVTAVDDCAEMLAEVRGAQTLCADVATVRLGRRFPCVLLMSCLFNEAHDELRQAFLQTCAAHVDEDGVVVIQAHDPGFLDRAKPGPLGADHNGVTFGWRRVERNGDVVSGTLEYRHCTDVWTQTFTARVFGEDGIRDELRRAGLRFDCWIVGSNWFTAKLL
jgi:SAM-dependent methyltransferase